MNLLRHASSFLGTHQDSILALTAILTSIGAIGAFAATNWQTNRTLLLNRDIATLQARQTIYVDYRKQWIADYRENVSQLLSMLYAVQLPGTDAGSKERQEQLLQLMYRQARLQLLSRDKNKVELAVNVLVRDAIHEVSEMLRLSTPILERNYSKLDQLSSDIVQGSLIVISDEEERMRHLQ